MMGTYTYRDLQIIDDDLVLDSAGIPVFITDRDVIAQDVRHALRESGVLFDLIGERRQAKRQLVYNKIKIVVENDNRIIPGTCAVTEQSLNLMIIEADTEFGPITLTADV